MASKSKETNPEKRSKKGRFRMETIKKSADKSVKNRKGSGDE